MRGFSQISSAPPKLPAHEDEEEEEKKKVEMWLFGRWRTNVSLQLQTAHLSQRRGEES